MLGLVAGLFGGSCLLWLCPLHCPGRGCWLWGLPLLLSVSCLCALGFSPLLVRLRPRRSSLLASLVVWAGISGDPRLTLSFVVSPPFLEEFASARFTPCNLNFKFSVMSSLIQVSHFICGFLSENLAQKFCDPPCELRFPP